ncbi:hypothetical protein FIBSPDRAFT_17505 [Athelia psychrophila]|uniref:Uncharacterized protein n=1 Tax=Athelia psychrophila TaxID=1759441 RepID=A0A166UA19_9AGAM|nr:hypothetical protein FIBSPDRAFT_17505 [Fibularhizoctonia sp. CBS 109695]
MLPKAVLHHLFLAISLAITSLWATNPGNNVAFSSKFLEAQTLVFGFGEVVAARVVGAMSALAIKDIQHDILQLVYDAAGMGSGEAGGEFEGSEWEIPTYDFEFDETRIVGPAFRIPFDRSTLVDNSPPIIEDADSSPPIKGDATARFDERETREEITRGERIIVFTSMIVIYEVFRLIIRWLARCFTTAADAPEAPDPDPNELPDEPIEAAQGPKSQEPAAASDADAVLAVTPDADATVSLDDHALTVPASVDASAIDSSSVEGSVAMVKADAVPAVAPATEMDAHVAVEVLAPPASAPVDASAATALVSDAAIPAVSAIEVHAATSANVVVPAAVVPSEYLSAEEFLAAHKAAHWNITANGKFRWDRGIPHYGLGPRCASAKSGANLKALGRLAGTGRPFFFPFMADLDGIATSVRTRVPHYVGPDGLLYAVGINGNAWIDHTGLPGGCAILPRPRKRADP